MPIFELCINLTHMYTMVFKVSIFIIHAYLICIVLYLSTTVFYKHTMILFIHFPFGRHLNSCSFLTDKQYFVNAVRRVCAVRISLGTARNACVQTYRCQRTIESLLHLY